MMNFCNQCICVNDGERASSWHHLLLPIITPLFPHSNGIAAACFCLVLCMSLFSLTTYLLCICHIIYFRYDSTSVSCMICIYVDTRTVG